jgi:hypothetical protein
MLDTDIIIATPEKSGTTWLQHMAHQLRAKGAEPDFQCQNDVRIRHNHNYMTTGYFSETRICHCNR